MAHLPGMKTHDLSDPRSRHRVDAFLAAAVAFLLLTSVDVYGLITRPPTSDPGSDVGTEPGPVVTMPSDPAPTATPRLPTVAASDDPETFARNVAEALFAWDTASGFMPLDYTSVILAFGDPTGAEQAGLASDIASYLPNREAWIELRQDATAQHLTIDNLFVPDDWDTAVAQAQPSQLAPGTIAYTIEGTRLREGLWNDEEVTSEHSVAFTMFLICAPTYDTCHLLRMSPLDNPRPEKRRVGKESR